MKNQKQSLESQSLESLRPNMKRLRVLLDGVNAFGHNRRTGGRNRPGFSAEDMAVRKWFAEQMRADGLSVWHDGAANVFGRFGTATGACVMAGSHLDTVPEGGCFDGTLGVCVALECVRTMRDAGLCPARAVEVVATSEEEGRFGGMLGSQAITGQLTAAWLDNASDANGVALAEVMKECGLQAKKALTAARPADGISAFIEMHIEQGPVLAASSATVGIVNVISGVCYLQVRLSGEANHSGTTPMDMRADAFLGLAEVGVAVRDIIARVGGEQSRITIGKVELQPNYAHTIAGVAEFSVIIRDPDKAAIRRMAEEIRQVIATASAANRLTAEVREKSRLPPIALDENLVTLLCAEAERLSLPHLLMPSGAGHDAQTMQLRYPSALIFVPSNGGVSHSPAEHTDWADIEKGAQLMLNVLIRLSGAMV